jgi:hypothetical protein
MKYIFTSQYLKVLPPATSFGEAWELLCFDLLRAENPSTHFQHLLPPDRGVDFLRRSYPPTAYQCKFDERGAFGTAPMQASLESLSTALRHRRALGWENYCFATNADYSGKAVEEIGTLAESLALSKAQVEFLGPQYWSDVCEKHLHKVQHRLDFRLQVTEQQVIEAFRKARYYEEKVEEYRKQIASGNFVLEVKNNRTPLRLAIPFSPELTVRHCLEVAMQLLGITLDSETYSDLDTSARPSISITVDRVPQGFSKRIGDFTDEELRKLELWITVVWKDELENRRGDVLYLKRLRTYDMLHLTPKDRRATTVERYERSLQQTMWHSAVELSS